MRDCAEDRDSLESNRGKEEEGRNKAAKHAVSEHPGKRTYTVPIVQQDHELHELFPTCFCPSKGCQSPVTDCSVFTEVSS